MHEKKNKDVYFTIFQHTSLRPRSLPKSSDCDSFNSCYSKTQKGLFPSFSQNLRIQALFINISAQKDNAESKSYDRFNIIRNKGLGTIYG